MSTKFFAAADVAASLIGFSRANLIRPRFQHRHESGLGAAAFELILNGVIDLSGQRRRDPDLP